MREPKWRYRRGIFERSNALDGAPLTLPQSAPLMLWLISGRVHYLRAGLEVVGFDVHVCSQGWIKDRRCFLGLLSVSFPCKSFKARFISYGNETFLPVGAILSMLFLVLHRCCDCKMLEFYMRMLRPNVKHNP